LAARERRAPCRHRPQQQNLNKALRPNPSLRTSHARCAFSPFSVERQSSGLANPSLRTSQARCASALGVGLGLGLGCQLLSQRVALHGSPRAHTSNRMAAPSGFLVTESMARLERTLPAANAPHTRHGLDLSSAPNQRRRSVTSRCWLGTCSGGGGTWWHDGGWVSGRW
jgi:hypothetical protein